VLEFDEETEEEKCAASAFGAFDPWAETDEVVGPPDDREASLSAMLDLPDESEVLKENAAPVAPLKLEEDVRGISTTIGLALSSTEDDFYPGDFMWSEMTLLEEATTKALGAIFQELGYERSRVVVT